MAKKSAKELKEEGAALSDLIVKARKKPHNFALVLAKDDGIVLEADPRKPTPVMWRQAKANGGSSKGVMGQMSVQGKVIQFSLEEPDDPPKVLLMQTKRHLKDRGLAFKIAFLMPSGGEFGDSEEETETEGAKTARASQEASAPETGGVSDTPEEAGAGDGSTSRSDLEAMLKNLVASVKTIAQSDAGVGAKLGSGLKQAAGYISKDENGPAQALLTKLEAAVKAAESKFAEPGAKPADDTDPDTDQPSDLRAEVEAAYAQVSTQLAEIGQHGQKAIAKKAKHLETTFAEFLSSENYKKASGLVSLAKSFVEKEYSKLEETTSGLMASATEMVSDAVEAVTDTAETVAGAVDDFVDGLTDDGRKKLELQRLGVSEADQDRIVAELQSNPNALVDAKQKLVDDLEVPDEVKEELKALAAKDPAAFEDSLNTVKELGVEGMPGDVPDNSAEISRAGNDARADFASLAAGMDNAEAIDAELERLKARFDSLAEFVPDKAAEGAQAYKKAKKACTDGELDQAKDHAAIIAGLIGEAEIQKAAILKRKEDLLAAVGKIQAPEGATDAERASLETLRKTVTDELAANTPTPANFAAALSAHTQMMTLLPGIIAAIAVRKATAEILAEHAGHLREITRLITISGDTTKGEKLQRRLEFESEQVEKLCANLKPAEARAMLNRALVTIPELQAEETVMAEAAALRKQFEREYAAFKPRRDKAGLFYGIDETFETLVEEFRSQDKWVSRLVHENQFGRAIVQLDELKRVTDRMLAKQAEFDAIVALRKTFKDAWKAYLPVRNNVIEMKITLADVAALYGTFYKADEVALAAEKKSDFVAAAAAVPAARAAADAVFARKADCDTHAKKYDEALKRYNAAKAIYEPIAKGTLITDELIDALKLSWQLLGEFRKAFWHAPDMDLALKAVAKFEKQVKKLPKLVQAQDAAIIERDRIKALALAETPKITSAKQVKPATDAMMALYKTFETALVEFESAMNSAEKDCEKLLKSLVKATDAVLAGVADNAGHDAAAKTACDARQAEVKPKVDAAMILGDTYPTELGAKTDTMAANWGAYQTLYTDMRYLEGKAALDALETLAREIDAAAAAAKTLVDQREAEFTGKYTAAFVARLDAIAGYVDTSSDMKTKRTEVGALRTAIETSQTARLFSNALADFAKLDPLVTELEALKTGEAALEADRVWVTDKLSAKGPDIQKARDIATVDRETAAANNAYDFADKTFFNLYEAPDFPESRVFWPEFDKAVDDLNALQGNFDALKDKKKSVSDAWAVVHSDYLVARDMRPLTPELKGLTDKYDTALALYNKAYYSQDWDKALVYMPDLTKAIADLIAKKADHDAADVAAKTKADATQVTLETISDAELKSKTADEKLTLLNDLRGQKTKLTDEQRAMQRKIYNSMDLDPDFVIVDDKRREELKDAILKDTELQAARANWASTDPEAMIDPAEKIRLLTKTLKKECELYDMPLPVVNTYSEPPGSLGFFNPGDGSLNINIHEEATFDDFYDTIDTCVHENAHHYQDTLVEKLEEGLLTPDDPEFKQALLFQSNSGPYAYVDGDEDQATYEKQPLEEHAWKVGGGVQDALKAAPSM